MNKENVCTGELSDEQRARISRNFKAAKALLDRKRLRDAATPGSLDRFLPKNGVANGNGNPGSIIGIGRVPLSDISVNTPSPLPVRSFKLMKNECNSFSSCGGLSGNTSDVNLKRRTTVEISSEVPIKQIEDSGNVCSKSMPMPVSRVGLSAGLSVTVENGKDADSVVTPVKLLECSANLYSGGLSVSRPEANDGGFNKKNPGVVSVVDGFGPSSYITPVRQQKCSRLSASSASPGISDEDFDESFFGEIDALCEKTVHRSDGCSADIQLQSECSVKCLEDKNDVVPIILEKTLITPDGLGSMGNQECPEEGLKSLRGDNSSQLEGMPEEYANYLRSLNERQREAACSDISVPLMIVAGPGSGKTSTMVGRVLMLLHEGIAPSHILAMTFTTAAASEMRDRIGKVAGKATSKELMISTFHSFSLQLCRTHAEKLGRTPEFLLYGQGQQRRAIIEAVRLTESEKNVQSSDCSKSTEESAIISSPKHFKDKSKKWLKFVTQAKASGKNSEDCHKMGDEMGAAILRNYENILKSCNALDYHDLISCSLKLLTDCPEVFKECQESWKAIVVDEFQDTSAMQYGLLRILASHNHITIVGDEDQSIFSFNGADISGFRSFRKDFHMHKEIRLNKNYRSTRCIVEAASSLIQNNLKRCRSQNALTDNSFGSKITIKECSNEDAQCAFIVDKILEISSGSSSPKGSFGDVAVLYRRQVSGKKFQAAFRERKIPFNTHGVAFYRKKVVRAIMSMLRTTLPDCDDGSCRRVFKALLPLEKEDKQRVIEHIDKVSTVRKCNFILAASDVFSAKISGTFKRSQLTQGRKVLLTLEMVSKLVHREQSVSAVITSVANMIPQKYLLEQRAVVDADGVKLLNEDNDLRPVLQYLLDDVSEFLTSKHANVEGKRDGTVEEKGCVNVLKAFIDFITERETENFRSRRHDNEHSVTLTTIHQSKGLEWDTVFIVKANESEIPLLHEFNGVTKENVNSLEEERRLLYVAMTRARKKLFILYVIMDSSWQVLQPSRFLREIPKHLLEVQDEPNPDVLEMKHQENTKETLHVSDRLRGETESTMADMVPDNIMKNELEDESKESLEAVQVCDGNNFLKRFATEERAVVSHLFHQWAKKAAFKEPKRLLDKVSFVIDERLRLKKSTHKDALRSLKSCLSSDEAFHYAENVLRWLQIPAEKRAYLMREKQEHFQKLRIESAMGSSAPTAKQISYLQNLGCTVVPTSRLHASHLIEQYKSL